MIAFDNTLIAFESKTNKDIQKAYRLFKLLKYPFWVRVGKIALQVALFIHFPINRLVKKNIFEHFCGGESMLECEQTVKDLDQYHIKTILDYSAEGGETEADMNAVFAEISTLIEHSAQDPAIPFAVFKPSGIIRKGLLLKLATGQQLSAEELKEYDRARQRFVALCDQAAALKQPLFVDAEESWIQPPVDDLLLEMMRKHNQEKAIIFNTIQLYRTDRLKYLSELTEIAQKEKFFIGLKLVRGAYLEKERERAQQMGYPSPVYGTKTETDTSFNNAVEFCFEHSAIISVCCASHNELSCSLLVELMESGKTPPVDPHFWFAQLFGMSDHISYNLAKAGYNVCKYVPYGPIKSVLPYLIRRSEENTSIAGQTGRELRLIITEQKRRKSIK